MNTLAALAPVARREVLRVTDHLRQFLRASFDQQHRVPVPLAEELAVVRAYLDIESLRLGDRLKVEQTIDPGEGGKQTVRITQGRDRSLRRAPGGCSSRSARQDGGLS